MLDQRLVQQMHSLIEENKLLLAGQVLKDELRERIGQLLSEIFDDEGVVPTQTHFCLSQINFAGVLTSNYDSLIEGAYTHQLGGRLPLVFTHQDFYARPCPLRNQQFFIFKIHGDHRRPETVILGTRDYQDIQSINPAYRHFLERCFTNNTILFVGYGGTDPDIDDVLNKLNAIYRGAMEPHYILLARGRVGEAEKRLLARDRGLFVLEYDPANNHREVSEFLVSLRDECAPQKEFLAMNGHRKAILAGFSRNLFLGERVREVLSLAGLKYSALVEEGSGLSWVRSLGQQTAGCQILVVLFDGNPDPARDHGALLAMQAGATPILLASSATAIPAMFADSPYLLIDQASAEGISQHLTAALASLAGAHVR